MEPGIEELRKSMPKAIAIPSHDWGVEGNFLTFKWVHQDRLYQIKNAGLNEYYLSSLIWVEN